VGLFSLLNKGSYKMFLKKSSVIEMLYDHLSYYSFNFFKISNIYTHQKKNTDEKMYHIYNHILVKYQLVATNL
jgi:hypothetical protein